MKESYGKVLAPNDAGETGGHQGGVCIPRRNKELLSFFPVLDANEINPEAWIECIDPEGEKWKLRYVYYNGKLHGTSSRNEYRITYLTKFMKAFSARSGDLLMFTKNEDGSYAIRIERRAEDTGGKAVSESTPAYGKNVEPVVIKLRGWRKVH